MKHSKLIFVLLLALSFMPFGVRPAQGATTNEEELIQVLQSGASPQAKDAACAQLKHIGTERSIPALSALLTDDQLSHSARYALEPMSSPEAGRSLLGALDKTSGATRVGIIDSLGVRREAAAVPALKKLLSSADTDAATAAASSLGQIADSGSLDALLAVLSNSAIPAHKAAVDSLLRCANRLLASGDSSRAKAIFQRLYESEKGEVIQVAAFRGLVRSSGRQALPLMTKAITGKTGPSQTAAFQLVHELDVPGTSSALAALLPKISPMLQVPLIEGLSQRDDPSAAPAVAKLVTSSDPKVRTAAIEALGTLGNSTVVPLLAESAASASGSEQAAARDSLVELRRGHVEEAMLAELAKATPAVQAEIARAFGARGDTTAVPGLQNLAQQSSGSTRKAAVQALAQLVDQPQLASMVQLVVEAKDETSRAQAAEALNSACQHVQSRRGRLDVTPLIKGLAAGSAPARIALLPICGGFSDPQVRSALRVALADPNMEVHTVAIRTLCDTTDGQLLPDLEKQACTMSEKSLRNLAVAGCVRLATQEESVKLSNAQKLETLRSLLSANPDVEQKRMILAGVAEVPNVQALEMAESMLDNAELREEAARAIIKIAPRVPESEVGEAALNKALDSAHIARTDEAAMSALKQIQAKQGFITLWQVAGPYRQADKDYVALFDISFQPETTEGDKANWSPLACGPNPKTAWRMDLAKALGGDECVAYARTWVHCDQKEPALLEIGSDDGVKVWLNQKLVHANNCSRALQPGSDRVDVQLDQGWNQLLFKITQHNQGWAFCARLAKPDGSRLDDLKIEASGH